MARNVISITETELLDELAASAAGNSPEEAKTVKELCEESGLSATIVRRALGAFKKQERLQVHIVSREALDGRMARHAGYTITPVKKARRVGLQNAK